MQSTPTNSYCLGNNNSNSSSSAVAPSPAASSIIKSINSDELSYICAATAQDIDNTLMTQPGFSLDQLMELAGLSVAEACHDYVSSIIKKNVESTAGIIILVGPGNNGGDGLVAARHLHHFGYKNILLIVPRRNSGAIFANLLHQLSNLGVEVKSDFDLNDDKAIGSYDLIVDGVFGFGFNGIVREPYTQLLSSLWKLKDRHILSIDVPSGYSVDDGDVFNTTFIPSSVISLTTPKLCMKSYDGIHYLGGRFLPSNVAKQYNVSVPDYGYSVSQIARIVPSNECSGIVNDSNVLVTGDKVTALLVTASSVEEADKITENLLSNDLVACVNQIPKVKSTYKWEGKIETSEEILMIIKTRVSLVDTVVTSVKAMHSYSVPEILAVDISGGSSTYIDWVLSSTIAGGAGSDNKT